MDDILVLGNVVLVRGVKISKNKIYQFYHELVC